MRKAAEAGGLPRGFAALLAPVLLLWALAFATLAQEGDWRVKASAPTERTEVAVAALEGKIYVMGGFRRFWVTSLVEAYDPAADRWSEKAPLPTPRSGIAASVLNGVIHVFGGESPEGTFDTVEAYHPARDSWRTLAPMPTSRHGLGAAAVEGKIFVLSGGPEPGGSFSAVNEVFTPPR